VRSSSSRGGALALAACPLLLFLMVPQLFGGVEATSSKMDYLPLGHVRTDPVTDPKGMSSHVHTFYGAAASLRPSTGYDELRAACGNSGNVDDNKSLYWHPTIYKKERGLYHAVPISFASTYYVWKTGKTKAFPDGFQMIARQTNGPKARVKFDCNGPSQCERGSDCGIPEPCSSITKEGQSVGYECFPKTACSELEVKIVFPSCWDGKSLTSQDFMSHVAYTKGNWGRFGVDDRQYHAYAADCPSTHPVRIPEIQFYFRIVGYEGGHHVFADGTSLVHADYFSGWDEAQLQRVLDECSNDSEAASSDAWCENHLSFRDMPKLKGDERIVEKLKGLQPNPPLDLQLTVSSEPVTAIPKLPGPSSSSVLLPADPDQDWRCTTNCSLIGSTRGFRSTRCETQKPNVVKIFTSGKSCKANGCTNFKDVRSCARAAGDFASRLVTRNRKVVIQRKITNPRSCWVYNSKTVYFNQHTNPRGSCSRRRSCLCSCPAASTNQPTKPPRTTMAPTTNARVFKAVTEKTCAAKSGCRRIISRSECTKAMVELTSDTALTTQRKGRNPRGCFAWKGTQTFWNTHSIGGRCTSLRRCLCSCKLAPKVTASPTPKITASPTAEVVGEPKDVYKLRAKGSCYDKEGCSTIIDKEECKSATLQLMAGKGDMSVRTQAKASTPGGCFAFRGQQVYFNRIINRANRAKCSRLRPCLCSCSL